MRREEQEAVKNEQGHIPNSPTVREDESQLHSTIVAPSLSLTTRDSNRSSNIFERVRQK